MNILDIKEYEKPIFNSIQEEQNRILASEVSTKINLSNEEFWDNFFKYILDKTKIKYKISDLKIGKILNINDDENKMKTFIVLDFKQNEFLELASLSGDNLNKILIKTELTKFDKEIFLTYLESKRNKELLDKKEHKRRQAIYNSRVINKVLILKEYLLNQVRDKK